MRFLRNVRIFLVRYAVKIALRRPAPDSFPIIDLKEMRSRYYYLVYFSSDQESWKFQACSIEKQEMTGRIWQNPGVSPPTDHTIPISSIPGLKVEIIFYYRELELNYSSSVRFLLSNIFICYFVLLVWKRTRLYFYKQRELVRKDRIKVLELVLERTIKDHNHCASWYQIMREIYGPLWVHHSDSDALGQYYKLILKSLDETADLNGIEQDVYQLAPKALATLSNYEEDERRHRDHVKLQIILIIITGTLVVVGLLQVFPIW